MSEEDVYYEVSVLLSELNIMSKKCVAEDRAMTEVQVSKMKDMLEQIDTLYGQLG